ncbi:Low density lipoprotein receptor adapter protein 1 [Pseudolycoriella hygida]|uniref:Low density lipoprotein receptor adapter protein 1 n=1 Tax=Pseudolycoriella hygida TaxID=35572 RepID=A0A9Q0MK31_9DIPT|nr:Low density lipoprotein receptor adapter protein 1 [Pseudolycoriella hygida]
MVVEQINLVKMAFLKIWKNNAKHRKLSEEWALATSLKDLSENHYDLDDETEAETFALKYLGNTVIESASSKEATADAVKSIISTAKATNRKLQRVNLSISPKGIEMLDSVTSETLMRVSIYKISYCSADAAHANVFAFVGSEDLDTRNSDKESLVCFAFLCPKRKVTHKVTLTVARSFEAAYQIWRESDERKKYKFAPSQNQNPSVEQETDDGEEIRSLLIDFNSDITTEICGKDHRSLLQNTWVSFDDSDTTNSHFSKSQLHDDALWERQMINCS